ncbi:MAG: nucleotidyltransferase domain-containing protein [Candidatus Aenigmarchaeota archaeon]|nr:nucleotidyltransferase domain-containing protein [Candidatus Aenigmarchaeota archaeon]
MGKANPEAIKLAKDFKKKAAGKFAIDKIILFGSQATGKTREGSDIDLLVVSKNVKKRAVFMSALSKEWHIAQKKNKPVDFLCYTPEEFRAKSKGITIVRDAVKHGVEV